MTVPDPGAAVERTLLSRRRTALPFLVVAAVGLRVALERPVPGLLLAVVACLATLALRRPALVAPGVVLLAAVAVVLPEP